jgi:flagellar biosynthetic protein FliP
MRIRRAILTALAVAAALVPAAAALGAAARTKAPDPAGAAIVPPSLEPRGGVPTTGIAPSGAGARTDALPAMGDLVAIADKATGRDSGAQDYSAPVKLAIVFTGLALLPAALMLMTSFTRIVIVLSFIRRALTTQNIPPTMAIVGLAIFLTLFTMAPTFTRINDTAVRPYLAGQLGFEAAAEQGIAELKVFMVRQTRRSDLAYFVELAKAPPPRTAADLPAHVAIPAFAISEFRTAFEMGCLLFIPFLLIDLVIAGILLSAGMMMLPPAIISLPLKIILFVLVDGWKLLAMSLVTSFN